MRIRALSLCAAAALSCGLVAAPAQAAVVSNVISTSAADAGVKLSVLGSYDSGILGASAAEIVAYHPASQRIFTVNAQAGEVDILDASDPAKPVKVGSLSAGDDKEINSVAVRPDGLGVVAVQQADKTEAGEALFFNAATGEELGRVPVGPLPDNVHITADGAWALLANEGEPSNELNAEGTDYARDPEGSVSIIALPSTVAAPAAADARVADFRAFDGTKLPAGVRVFGPPAHDAKPSIDFEPEYITSADGKAYVTLQEANAIGVIDIASATVEKILPAHIADHSTVALDSSNKDGAAQLRTIPVHGLSMPDSIGAFTAAGQTYFATANEGDAREWGVDEDEGGSGVYTDETSIEDLAEKQLLCGDAFPLDIAEEKVAGKLKVSAVDGFNEDKGCYDALYSYGSRSFSIYDASGAVVFDSGSEFEEITAKLHAEGKLSFNADNEDNKFDDRSDNKGPEPEALTIGTVGDRTYAFIGAERVGGVFVYDITDPANAKFATYINNRDFSVDIDLDDAASTAAAGDLGPEGFAFVDKKDSPNGQYLLVVGNEVSGTTTIYQVEDLLAQAPETPEEPETPEKPENPGDKDSSSIGSSAAGIVVAVLAALGAAVAAAYQFVPGIKEQLRTFLPFLR